MVLIGCCFFQCAMIGILINCIGVLFAQIRAELGFSMSRVSLYNTLKSVSTSLLAGVITAIFFKANKARFLLLNQCAIVLSFLLIILGAEGPLWYLSAIINGAAFCIANIAVPMLLGRWFPEHSGAVTGIAMAFSGIGGAVCNPVCAALIQNLGWQWTIVVLGIITMAMTIPGTALEPLTSDYVKKLHYLLTYGTYADRKQYFGSGTFRTKPPRLYKDTAADPREIARKLNKLVMDYEKESADLEKILEFHVCFERIRPFADYNGRVGRLILIKECLRYGVDPFILDDKRRTAYYRGIARWDEDSSVLMETVLQAQARFQNQMETCMLMEYCRPANPRKL